MLVSAPRCLAAGPCSMARDGQRRVASAAARAKLAVCRWRCAERSVSLQRRVRFSAGARQRRTTLSPRCHAPGASADERAQALLLLAATSAKLLRSAKLDACAAPSRARSPLRRRGAVCGSMPCGVAACLACPIVLFGAPSSQPHTHPARPRSALQQQDSILIANACQRVQRGEAAAWLVGESRGGGSPRDETSTARQRGSGGPANSKSRVQAARPGVVSLYSPSARPCAAAVASPAAAVARAIFTPTATPSPSATPGAPHPAPAASSLQVAVRLGRAST
jgi:hypothetical protein